MSPRSIVSRYRTCAAPVHHSAAHGVGLTLLSLGSSLVIAILPKCPLCLAALAGTLTLIGIDVSILVKHPNWIFQIAFGLLGCGMLVILLRARNSGIYGPLYSAVLGVAVLMCGKFFLDSAFLTFASLLPLVVAFYWSYRTKLNNRPTPSL